MMLRRKQQKLGVDVSTVNDMDKTLLILAAHLRDYYLSTGQTLQYVTNLVKLQKIGHILAGISR